MMCYHCIYFPPSLAIRPKLSLNVSSVMKAVCNEFDVTEWDVLGPSRVRAIVEARQTMAFILIEKFGYTMNKAAHFLNRDHSTIVVSRKVINNQLTSKCNTALKIRVNNLLQRFE